MNVSTVSQDFKSYFSDVKQNTLAVMVKLKDFRNDTEFFLKVCEAAVPAILLIMARYPTAGYLSKLQVTLETANMHDFYRFLRQPRRWFCPVEAATINENATLDSLTHALCQVFNASKVSTPGTVELEEKSTPDGVIEPEEQKSTPNDVIESEEEFIPVSAEFIADMRLIAKAYLQKQLEDGDAYVSVEEFKEVLQRRFAATGKDKEGKPLVEKDKDGKTKIDVSGNPILVQGTHLGKVCIVDGQVKLYRPEDDEEEDIESFDLGNISLEDIKDVDVPLRHVPLAEMLNNFIWSTVDVVGVIFYGQIWDLVDTAAWAERIGTKYPALQWVKSHPLGLWMRGLFCCAYGAKLFEACRKLRDDQLTAEERRHAQWHRVTACADLLSNIAGFANATGFQPINPTYLRWMAIVAKTLGLLEIATRPKHKFFETTASAT